MIPIMCSRNYGPLPMKTIALPWAASWSPAKFLAPRLVGALFSPQLERRSPHPPERAVYLAGYASDEIRPRLRDAGLGSR